MEQMTLIIDDLRSDDGIDHCARTSVAGKEMLTNLPVTHLYLDHDLGEDDSAAFRNGYELLSWALENDLCPSNVMLVTMNPVGRRNMIFALTAHGYVMRNGWFTKESM